MRTHPAARPRPSAAPGPLGGMRSAARASLYGTGATSLLPRVAIDADSRQPRVALGSGELRTDVSDTWALVGWDPVRVVVGLDADDPVAGALVPGATACLSVGPRTATGPRWRGHAALEAPLGLLLLSVEHREDLEGRVIIGLMATDGEARLLRRHQALARRARGGEADAAEAVAWSVIRPIGLATTAVGADEHIFPVDLAGPLGGGLFALSLRAGAASAAAVQAAGRLVWSTIDASAGRSAFDLRTRHGRAPQGALSADVRHYHRSATLDLPVPMWALRATELRVAETRALGDHRVTLARVERTTRVRDADALGHLHRDALAWREGAGWRTRRVD